MARFPSQLPIRTVVWVIVGFVVINGCATLEVTPYLPPDANSEPIPAKLEIQASGASLKQLLATSDLKKLGLAPGQMFREVAIAQPSGKAANAKEISNQSGPDLILHVQPDDFRLKGATNPYFATGILLMFWSVFTPLATFEVTISLNGNLRDARTGEIVWEGTESFSGTDHYSPVGMDRSGEKITDLIMRTYHNAFLKLLNTVRLKQKNYKPAI